MMRASLLVFVVVSCVAGCGAAQREPEPLDQSVRVYNDGLRWQRFDEAASRLPADRRDDFLDQRDQLHDDLRISDYEVIRVRYDGKQRRAKVQVKYTWYLESRGVVHETHAVQTWHRGAEIWVLRGERHLRGETMPGLEESKDKDKDKAEGEPRARTDATTEAGPDADAPSSAAPEPLPDAPGDPPGEDPAAPDEDAAEPPQGS
ncbi:MAG TPA: hypothetical protein VNM90_25335 [Haliangium sp.]|nr:hypothetical protein [Haliangium sp.]